MVQHLLTSFAQLSHRGCAPTRLGAALAHALANGAVADETAFSEEDEVRGEPSAETRAAAAAHIEALRARRRALAVPAVAEVPHQTAANTVFGQLPEQLAPYLQQARIPGTVAVVAAERRLRLLAGAQPAAEAVANEPVEAPRNAAEPSSDGGEAGKR